MSFKRISYLELWRPFCSAELNYLCTFGRRHHGKHFREIILNLERWFRKRCHLNHFLSGTLVDPFTVEWNHLCNFGTGYYARGTTLVNNFEFGPVVQERCHLKYFLSGALAALVLVGAELFLQFC